MIMLLNHEIHTRLMDYEWPGNVRELENIVERMIALSFSGVIDTSILDSSTRPHVKKDSEENFEIHNSLEDYISGKEKGIIEWALKRSHNNISQAVKFLKVPRTTLNSKLDRLFPEMKF